MMDVLSKAEVERLSREVAVERLAEAKGVNLTRDGKTLTGRCPFHQGDPPKAPDPARHQPLPLRGLAGWRADPVGRPRGVFLAVVGGIAGQG